MNAHALRLWNRRQILSGLVYFGAAARLPADPERKVATDHITPEAQKAIDRGLAYLARSQAMDGSWGDTAPLRGNVAVTALAGMAFLSAGCHPGRGQYGDAISKAIQFVLAQESQHTTGFLYRPINSTHGPMYSHGFGTLFLAEVYGAIDDPTLALRVRATLDRAVQLILASQNGEGGWRYQPIRDAADVSVTICQIMALRSARNAGLAVPKSAADKCVEYVKACRTPDGGFRYFKGGGGPAFPRSAAGLCALYSAGVYHGPDIDKALRYLKQFKPGPGGRRDPTDTHYYYGHYYAAQAFWTAGEPHWSDWFPAIRDDLVGRGRQRPDGAWTDPYFGYDYATSMACIVLQIPNNYLPILQK